MKTLTNYDQQAIDFLEKTGAKLEIEFLKHGKHFEDDKEIRDIYKITLNRGARKYTFNFGQSLAKSLKYVDKQTKNEFTQSGRSLKGNLKVNNISYLQIYCTQVKGKKPTFYDILACLTKHSPSTFEDFCSEFGYDTDSKKAEKIYRACLDEYLHIIGIFNESEIAELQEIQ